MIAALLNKIASFHAMWTSQTSPHSPAPAKTPTTQTTFSKRGAQNESKGIQSDAFFFAPASADPHIPPSHPDGSNCGAGCGGS